MAYALSALSHLTRGAWIEIIVCTLFKEISWCRTSHEVRGLKCLFNNIKTAAMLVAPHTRCVDWNLFLPQCIRYLHLSHLTRGAWIEIRKMTSARRSTLSRTSHEVRGLKSQLGIIKTHAGNVAPHTRCVDWNLEIITLAMAVRQVAPHTRCVDWNCLSAPRCSTAATSHLTRGAWIEIQLLRRALCHKPVAPHTRCVDWNPINAMTTDTMVESHLTRGV